MKFSKESMHSLAYDLHIHSCLSPCAEEDMTPCNIVGMAMIKELDVIAITDHNSCKNCKAAMEVGQEYGILVLPGMELTTVEEVHVLCLFANITDAMAYDAYVSSRLQPFPNHEAIFGKQTIRNAKDEIVGVEPNLLIQSTTIAFHQVYELLESFHGVMIPAHIHKKTHSMLANLAFVPEGSQFTMVECSEEQRGVLSKKHTYLEGCKSIYNSDAHYLQDIHEPIWKLEVEENTAESIIRNLRNR